MIARFSTASRADTAKRSVLLWMSRALPPGSSASSLQALPGWLNSRFGDKVQSQTERASSRRRELSGQFQSQKEALQQFTEAMEEEFLNLGGLVRKITKLARHVRERSDGIIATASGSSEDAPIHFAFQLLKKAEDLVRASREHQDQVFLVFQKIHADLGMIAKERTALLRALFPLKTTTIQFRIQASAFDAETREKFFTLAEAVTATVADIETAVGQGFEELEKTGRSTGDLVLRLSTVAEEQKHETEQMMAECRNHLFALDDVLQSSGAVAESLSESGAKIAGGVTAVVIALQCQDMARQKFEHINAAMDGITEFLGANIERELTASEETDCQVFLAETGRIQIGQLQAVFKQLTEAADQITSGLQQVESESGRFAEQARLCGGATLDKQVIGRAIASIQTVLGVIEKSVSGIQSAASLVQKLRSTFSDCTGSVLGLALRLRMVALNAQIFASQVSGGAALEEVAQNTRLIADEGMGQLDGISSRINNLIALIIDLEQQLGDYRELADVERLHLEREARLSEHKLLVLEEDLRKAVAEMTNLERELSGTVNAAHDSIHFPEMIAKASADSTALFEGVVLKYAAAAGSGSLHPHEKVEQLKRNYTMADEREVHAAAVSAPTPADQDPFADCETQIFQREMFETELFEPEIFGPEIFEPAISSTEIFEPAISSAEIFEPAISSTEIWPANHVAVAPPVESLEVKTEMDEEALPDNVELF